MKKVSIALCIWLSLFVTTAKAAYISMVGGNTIDGSQLSVNNFGVAGTMGGFATGTYYYTWTRSGKFTTQNLTFSVNGTAWTPNANRTLSSAVLNVSLSGIIPYGVECGTSETITLKVYNRVTNQIVLTNTFTIRNPLRTPASPKFKVFGSTAASPTLIKGCGCSSKNILLNNLKLIYAGTGTVLQYRVVIKQATATGAIVPNGFQFTQNWVNGAPPATITLTNLAGQTTGTVPATWTYFLVTLEAYSGCTGLPNGSHTALVLLSQTICPK